MGAYDAAGLEKMGAHGLGASRDEGAALSVRCLCDGSDLGKIFRNLGFGIRWSIGRWDGLSVGAGRLAMWDWDAGDEFGAFFCVRQ
ncbi:hypothetical protein AAC387_Pa01g2401 [Persea americana]